MSKFKVISIITLSIVILLISSIVLINIYSKDNGSETSNSENIHNSGNELNYESEIEESQSDIDEEIYVDIKYDYNFGNMGEYSSSQCVVGSIPSPPQTPEIDEQVFCGWFIDVDYTKEYCFDSTISDNITLYAKWRHAYLDFVEVGEVYYVKSCEDYVVNDSFEVIIPETYEEKQVVGVFQDEEESSLKDLFVHGDFNTIIVPNSWQEIGDYAFKGCNNLQNIVLPKALNRIGKYAFAGTSVNITMFPDTLVKIDNYAFKNCLGLTKLTFNNNLKTLGIGVFESSSLSLVDFAGTSFTSINYGLFQNSEICEIVMPKGVQEIGDYAFNSCEKLASIDFTKSENLIRIGDNCFENCTKLDFILPENIEYIGRKAFANTAVEEINFPSSIRYNKSAIFIGVSAFENNKHLLNVDFSDNNNIDFLPREIFKGCGVLKKVILPSSLKSLSADYPEKVMADDIYSSFYSGYFFLGCINLTDIVLGENQHITYNNGVYYSSDGRELMWANPAIIDEDINIIEGCIKISALAFYGCNTLKSISLPASMRSIGYHAFAYSTLSSITFPSSDVELSIGDYAFYNIGLDYESQEIIQRITTDVYLLSSIPPKVGLSVFGNSSGVLNVIINIPSSLYETYIISVGWQVYKEYIHIIE